MKYPLSEVHRQINPSSAQVGLSATGRTDRAPEEAYIRQIASRSGPDLPQSDQVSQKSVCTLPRGYLELSTTWLSASVISLHTNFAI